MPKRLSSAELCWLVTNALYAAQPGRQTKIAVAIVADKSRGWRAIVANRSRVYI